MVEAYAGSMSRWATVRAPASWSAEWRSVAPLLNLPRHSKLHELVHLLGETRRLEPRNPTLAHPPVGDAVRSPKSLRRQRCATPQPRPIGLGNHDPKSSGLKGRNTSALRPPARISLSASVIAGFRRTRKPRADHHLAAPPPVGDDVARRWHFPSAPPRLPATDRKNPRNTHLSAAHFKLWETTSGGSDISPSPQRFVSIRRCEARASPALPPPTHQ